jgi:hypothetical protein
MVNYAEKENESGSNLSGTQLYDTYADGIADDYTNTAYIGGFPE